MESRGAHIVVIVVKLNCWRYVIAW